MGEKAASPGAYPGHQSPRDNVDEAQEPGDRVADYQGRWWKQWCRLRDLTWRGRPTAPIRRGTRQRGHDQLLDGRLVVVRDCQGPWSIAADRQAGHGQPLDGGLCGCEGCEGCPW